MKIPECSEDGRTTPVLTEVEIEMKKVVSEVRIHGMP